MRAAVAASRATPPTASPTSAYAVASPSIADAASVVNADVAYRSGFAHRSSASNNPSRMKSRRSAGDRAHAFHAEATARRRATAVTGDGGRFTAAISASAIARRV